ncbi:hypothetical protein HHK36_013435 [Tetracentron sinense]|uniref:Uncharacterized protein n=1 Tax=Tetracentron sinense TaxID=13715 RepID=A0A834Z3C6_TETSI|nr:hypothetical protein HHK36_013435 [Tetracentron sinense]
MGRSPCCDENGLKKGPWTPEEDQKLVLYIQQHGHGSWRALPKLAALANMRELMEHHPWEEHAVRLQAEAVQLAKLQYLQHLLQSATPLTNNSYSQTSINADMDAFNLFNSISQFKENPSLKSSQLETPSSYSLGIATSQPLHDSIPFSHLPDLHISSSFEAPLNSELGQGSNFSEFSHGDITPKSLWLPPPINETSIGNLGDACSTSSDGGGGAPSFWPELLLEYPFIP